MTEFSWKRIESDKYGGSITVDVTKDESLGLVWTLKVETNDGTATATIMNPHSQGNVPYLARIIRGIEDYLNLQRAIENDIKVDIDKISKMWVDFVAYLYNNDILLSGNVALISSIPIEMKGMRLIPTVIPKNWGDPIKDGVIIHFSNLYIGDYFLESEPNRRRPCFMLSAYDALKFGKTSAKDATKYISLHPIDDRELILKIIKNAVLLYPPNTKFDGGSGNDLRVITRDVMK